METRPTPASQAWGALLIAFTDIQADLAAELADECDMSMEYYEILLMLYEAGGHGLRPSEIADRRRLSRSGATRLVDRLVRDGLVDRSECDGDRRGSLVTLTDDGYKTFIRAGRFHLDGIERHVGSRLTKTEAVELSRLLTKLSNTDRD